MKILFILEIIIMALLGSCTQTMTGDFSTFKMVGSGEQLMPEYVNAWVTPGWNGTVSTNNMTANRVYFIPIFVVRETHYDYAGVYLTEFEDGTEKLLGWYNDVPDGYGGLGYQSICRFQASATGVMSNVKIKCSVSGNISYAVYADNGGSPSTRLVQQATLQSVNAGWNTLAIPNVYIVSGTYYWLAAYVATGNIGYNLASGTRKYKLGASTFADPFDNTGFSNDNLNVHIAGWGGQHFVQVRIYNWTYGVPGNAVSPEYTIEADDIGEKKTAIDLTLSRGYYFIGYVCSKADTYYGFDTGSHSPVTGVFEDINGFGRNVLLGEGSILTNPAPVMIEPVDSWYAIVKLREN